jgi:hypothetical protein
MFDKIVKIKLYQGRVFLFLSHLFNYSITKQLEEAFLKMSEASSIHKNIITFKV